MMSGSAAAALRSGTAMRTISQPASASSVIWASVATGSRVSAVAIDCTTTGFAPPILTSPTLSTRVLRRGASSMQRTPELRQERAAVEDPIDVDERDDKHQTEEQYESREVNDPLFFRGDLAPTAEHLDQDEE